ncbi:ABC transporter substrate-binding protein [Sediminispirochaeta bajacaliforniensis]|uniref:ABC transporter substrate-binding protein n=1 Tax=Sediminispirochaeta bajacaliforniensis TaxID=148 RepID=UPI00037607CC|nr:sugar ABC transporter substrate-binding protein [Sediminispirochaeta bajacaliforniensis]
MIKRTCIVMLMCCVLMVPSLWSQGQQDKGVEITYLTPETDPTSIETDNSIISDFEAENPGIKVILSHADLEQVLPKLSAMLRAGTAPDVAFLSPRYIAGLVDEGYLAELDDVYKELGDIPQRFVTPTQDGKIYDIPAATESKILYYRKDLFTEAGIAVPQTMDEWKDAAKALTVDLNGDGQIDRWGLGISLSPSDVSGDYLQILWAFGGDAFDENNNVTIDSPIAIEALQYLCDMTQYCPPGAITVTTSDLGLMFAKGVVAMVRFPGRMMSIIDRYNPELHDKVDVAAGPVGPKATEPLVKATINDFVVFSNSKNVEAAKKFVEFYMSDKQYYKFLTAAVPGHSLPVRQGWLNNDDYFDYPAIARWSNIVKKSMDLAYKYGTDFQFRNNGVVNPYFGRAISAPVFANELHKAISGQKTPEEALTTIAKEWRSMFSID